MERKAASKRYETLWSPQRAPASPRQSPSCVHLPFNIHSGSTQFNHLSRIFIIYVIHVLFAGGDVHRRWAKLTLQGRCCPLSPPSMLHLGIPHPLPATLPRPSLPFLLYSRDTYLLYLHLLFPCLISSHTTFKHENFKTDAISHYCTLQTISLVAEGGFIALLMECGHFLPVHLWHLLACAPLASLQMKQVGTFTFPVFFYIIVLPRQREGDYVFDICGDLPILRHLCD